MSRLLRLPAVLVYRVCAIRMECDKDLVCFTAASATFCVKGRARQRADVFLLLKKTEQSGLCPDVAHLSGFEPKAFRLGGGRSILLSYRCIFSFNLTVRV